MPTNLGNALWLINHETLAKWEIPKLMEAGFSRIFTPQTLPTSPTFSSGSVEALTQDWSFLPDGDLEILCQQDWYKEVDKSAQMIANQHFACAFVTADPTQVITILKAFSGLVAIRLFGLDGNRTYSDLYKFHLTPHEFSFLINNLHRILFATGYQEILENEEDWVVNNSCFLPIGVPKSSRLDWVGDSENVFSVVPRIEPNTYFSKSVEDHKKMVSHGQLRIGGRQHLIHSDENILGTLTNDEFNDFLIHSRCLVYASREQRHVHYHPLEAMQIGMPVVYFRNSLLYSILGKSDAGVVKNNRQAKKLVKKMIKDRDFASNIGNIQKQAVAQVETKALKGTFIEGTQNLKYKMKIFSTGSKKKLILCDELGHLDACPAAIFFETTSRKRGETGMSQKNMVTYVKYLEEPKYLTQLEAATKVGGLSAYSRTFQVGSTFLDLTNLDENEYEVIVCGTAYPEVILTKCSVTRILDRSSCKEIATETTKPNIELLRYTLESNDVVFVPDNESRNLILAFLPISNRRVQVNER